MGSLANGHVERPRAQYMRSFLLAEYEFLFSRELRRPEHCKNIMDRFLILRIYKRVSCVYILL